MMDMEKFAWIDEENMILAFHPFENGRRIGKEERLFWDWILILMRLGYRMM